MCRTRLIIILSLLLLSRNLLLAEDENPVRKYFWLGADTWLADEFGGNGIIKFALKKKDAVKKVDFYFVFNTDSLEAGFTDIGKGPFRVALRLKAEALMANLLMNYYQPNGTKLPGLGIWASYMMPSASVKLKLGKYNSLGYSLAGRGWFFNRTKDTFADYMMPSPQIAMEEQLSWTLWALKGPSQMYSPYWPFYRYRGFALNLTAAHILRSSTREWGLDNTPAQNSFILKLHLRTGIILGRRLRIQSSGRIFYGIGLDDLYRQLIGGQNPYSYHVPGLPWPIERNSILLAFDPSLAVKISDRLELGLLYSRAIASYPYDGLALQLDAWWDNKKLDIIIGWGFPMFRYNSSPSLGFFISYGIEL